MNNDMYPPLYRTESSFTALKILLVIPPPTAFGGGVCVLDFGHSARYIMVSHSCFNLHLPNDIWCCYYNMPGGVTAGCIDLAIFQSIEEMGRDAFLKENTQHEKSFGEECEWSGHTLRARKAQEHMETRKRSRGRATQEAKCRDTLQFLGVGSQHEDAAWFSKSGRHF